MENQPLSTRGVISAVVTATIPRLEAIFSPLLTQYPHWQLAIHEAIGLYGYYMACKQEGVNEFVEFLRSHPKEFRKEIIESEEFRNGFVLAFQDYLKLRTKEKREIAKHILLGFTEAIKKQEFPIEQLDDVLFKASTRSIEMLSFIQTEILPLKEMALRDKLSGKGFDKLEEERQFNLAWRRESVSKFIHTWVYENYSPSGEKMKEKYGDTGTWEKSFLTEVFEIEQKKSDNINDAVEELTHLGILKIRVVDGGLGSGAGSEYDFTQLGYRFLKYIS